MHRLLPILAYLIGLCIVTYGALQMTISAPVRQHSALGDPLAVQGVWGDEGGTAWSKGDTVVVRDRHGWADWRVLAVSMHAPTDTPVAVVVTINTQRVELVVAQQPRTLMLLDAVSAPGAPLRIQSLTTVVTGDRRALGVRIGALTNTRLAQPFTRVLWAVLQWMLPLGAAALWLWRRGVLGAGAWAALATLQLVMLQQELATGYANPTLLLVSPWRELWSILMVLAAFWPARPATAVEDVQGRRIGLDLLRAVAVGCVVVAHGLPLLFPSWNSERAIFRWFVSAGDVGVDIFFALSGYLIGAILLRGLPRFGHWDAVRRFWARRWLRTLPAAYVSALLVWLIAAPRDVGGYLQSIFFVATLNPAVLPSEMGFWWSLGAEEAFYLLFPLVLLPLLRLLPGIRAYMVALSLIGLSAFAVRTVLALVLPADVAGNVSYAIYARLDSLIWGVLIAVVRVRRADWYAWLAAHGAPIGLVCAAVGVMLLVDAPRWLVASIVLGHTAMTVGAALLIPALERWQTLGGPRRDWMVRAVALISYSLYLYHSMWEQRVHLWFGSATTWSEWVRNVAVYLGGAVILATLSYRLVEVPVLRWRDEKHSEE
jgi:peptidoglycan/LPS O-acetylase OafA/YrhL